jgi:hypothetical protein
LFTASFNCFPALNLTDFVAGILIPSLVCGLWPRRALLWDTAKVPNPTSVTFVFFRKLSVMASFTALMARYASALLIEALLATFSIRSPWFIQPPKYRMSL